MKPGATTRSVGVDCSHRGLVELPDRDDASVAHADVSPERRGPRPVHDRSPHHSQIEHVSHLSRLVGARWRPRTEDRGVVVPTPLPGRCPWRRQPRLSGGGRDPVSASTF